MKKFNLMNKNSSLLNKKSAAVLILLNSMLASNVFAGDIFPEDIFVTLKKSGELAKFSDSDKWQGHPVMLYNSLTPDAKRLVVSSPKTGHIYVYDTATKKELAAVKVQKAPKGLKISPNGQEVYVANEASATISIVDLNRYEEVAVIAVDKFPHNVRFDDEGKYAYVSLQGGAGVAVIDTQSRSLKKVIPTPGISNPHNLDISKDGSKLFIRDLSQSVGVLDLKTEKVIKVIPVGKGHAGIDVSPDGKSVYTGAIGDNILTVIDVDSLTVRAKINVGFGPHGVRASLDNKWIYVAVTGGNQLVVIDAEQLKIKQRFPLSEFPFWISVNGNP